MVKRGGEPGSGPNTTVSAYTVFFAWLNAVNVVDEPRHELQAETFEDAKVEAALLYACASFKGAPPTAYSIVQNGETEVYSYPERCV
jgi:hypothetical protein